MSNNQVLFTRNNPYLTFYIIHMDSEFNNISIAAKGASIVFVGTLVYYVLITMVPSAYVYLFGDLALINVFTITKAITFLYPLILIIGLSYFRTILDDKGRSAVNAIMITSLLMVIPLLLKSTSAMIIRFICYFIFIASYVQLIRSELSVPVKSALKLVLVSVCIFLLNSVLTTGLFTYITDTEVTDNVMIFTSTVWAGVINLVAILFELIGWFRIRKALRAEVKVHICETTQ